MRIVTVILMLLASNQIDAQGKLTPEEAGRLQRLERIGQASLAAGDLEQALENFTRAHKIYPASPYLAYAMACTSCRKGDLEGALEWLARAAELGFVGAAHAEGNPDLADLAGRPGLADVLTRFEANQSKLTEALYPIWRPDAEPLEGDNLDEIEAQLQGEIEALMTLAGVLPRLRLMRLHADIVCRYLAALEGYTDQDPPAADSDVAFLSRLLTLDALIRQLPRAIESDGDTLEDLAQQFLARFPESQDAGEAHLILARLGLRRAGEDEERLAQAVAALDQLANASPPATIGGKALVELVDHLAHRGKRARARELLTRLRSEYRKDVEVAQLATRRLVNIELRINGLAGFQGQDLDGREHTLETMQGHVTLVDFWATWCAPCRAELPQLTRLHEKHRDHGFQIVGVSLDHELSDADFRAWCKGNGVIWPQIHEGRGWDSQLARRFRISEIPCKILLGRKAEVLAVNPDWPELEELLETHARPGK